MAIVSRYRSTSRKAGVSGMPVSSPKGTTSTHNSALWRSFVIFSCDAECVCVVIVPWGTPRISWRRRPTSIGGIPGSVNPLFVSRCHKRFRRPLSWIPIVIDKSIDCREFYLGKWPQNNSLIYLKSNAKGRDISGIFAGELAYRSNHSSSVSSSCNSCSPAKICFRRILSRRILARSSSEDQSVPLRRFLNVDTEPSKPSSST